MFGVKSLFRKTVQADVLQDCTVVDISRNGKFVATGHDQGIVRIWDGVSLKQLHQFDLSTPSAVYPLFSPDGSRRGSIASNPVRFQDLAATTFRYLGIDLNSHWVNRSGRPIPIVAENGRPIPELF